MRIDFWTWSKKPNSTAVPGSPDTTQNIDLKSPCSVESPVIVLRNGGGVPGWNYCRIPGFGGRYYWINNWTYEDNCWIGELSVDVLGTYRGTIGSTSYYVLRSSTSFDGDIIDTLYPTKTNVTTEVQILEEAEYPQKQLKGGVYVVGVVGASGVNKYYAMTYNEFSVFSTQVFSNIDWAQSDGQQISNSLLKCLFNPFQYVVSCCWFPFSPDAIGVENLTEVTGIKFGYWEVEVKSKLISGQPVFRHNFAIPIKNHPQISRGKWLNSVPYRNINIKFEPFGRFSIDGMVVGNRDSINATITVDLISGMAQFAINSGTQYVHVSSTQLGVPLQVSDLHSDLIGAAWSGISGIAAAVSGNFLGAMQSVGNAASNLKEQVNSRGSNGSMLSVLTRPSVEHCFMLLTDEDRADNGRPLMKNGTFASLGSGYYVVENGSTSLRGATKMELDKVKSFLESGVYYQ